MKTKKSRVLLLILVLMLASLACTRWSWATPTATPTATAEPTAQSSPVTQQHPIVVLAPQGEGKNLPGVTGEELSGLLAEYSGGVRLVHTWDAFAANTRANADSRQPNHGHLWAGTCEGSVFHRGGVNMNLQNRDANFWLIECSTGDPSAPWAIWVPWAP